MTTYTVATWQIANAGSGYTSPEGVGLQGGIGPTGATFTVTAVNGSGGILSLSLVNGGSYTVVPGTSNVPLGTGGSGSGATVDVTYSTVQPPILFPTFLGLGYSVIRRPKGSTSIQTHVSGREVRVGYWSNPLYEWDLTFDVLRDFERNPSYYGSTDVALSELRRFEGFYLAMQGAFAAFYFKDPDDSTVTGQSLGLTDGTNSAFSIVRTYGDVGYGVTVTEPVGSINTSTYTAYLNGVAQTGTSIIGSPVAFQVQFASAPFVGQNITIDMQYYFYVRFKEDSLEFEKFFDKYWMVKKVTLVSLRG